MVTSVNNQDVKNNFIAQVNSTNAAGLTAGALVDGVNATFGPLRGPSSGSQNNTGIIVAAIESQGYEGAKYLNFNRVNLTENQWRGDIAVDGSQSHVKVSDLAPDVSRTLGKTVHSFDLVGDALTNADGIDGAQTITALDGSFTVMGAFTVNLHYTRAAYAAFVNASSNYDLTTLVANRYPSIIGQDAIDGTFKTSMRIDNDTFSGGFVPVGNHMSVNVSSTDKVAIVIAVGHVGSASVLTDDAYVRLDFDDGQGHTKSFPVQYTNTKLSFSDGAGANLTELDSAAVGVATDTIIQAIDLSVIAALVPGLTLNSAGTPLSPSKNDFFTLTVVVEDLTNKVILSVPYELTITLGNSV